MVLVSTFFTTFFCNNQSSLFTLYWWDPPFPHRINCLHMQNKFTGNYARTSCIFITLMEPFLFTNSSLQPHQSSAQLAMTDCFCCSVAAETNYTTLIYRHLDCSEDKYSFSSFAFEIRIMSSCLMYSALSG